MDFDLLHNTRGLLVETIVFRIGFVQILYTSQDETAQRAAGGLLFGVLFSSSDAGILVDLTTRTHFNSFPCISTSKGSRALYINDRYRYEDHQDSREPSQKSASRNNQSGAYVAVLTQQ